MGFKGFHLQFWKVVTKRSLNFLVLKALLTCVHHHPWSWLLFVSGGFHEWWEDCCCRFPVLCQQWQHCRWVSLGKWKKEMLLEINVSETPKNIRVDFVVFAGCWEDGSPHGHRVQHPQSARSRHRMQDQPAIKHCLQGLWGAPEPADRGEHDQRRCHGVGMPCRQGSAPTSPATSSTGFTKQHLIKCLKSFIRFGRWTCTGALRPPTTSLSSTPRTCCAAGKSASAGLTTVPAVAPPSSLTSRTAGRRGGFPSSPSNMASPFQMASLIRSVILFCPRRLGVSRVLCSCSQVFADVKVSKNFAFIVGAIQKEAISSNRSCKRAWRELHNTAWHPVMSQWLREVLQNDTLQEYILDFNRLQKPKSQFCSSPVCKDKSLFQGLCVCVFCVLFFFLFSFFVVVTAVAARLQVACSQLSSCLLLFSSVLFVAGCSFGPHLQRRFGSGQSRWDGDGSGSPHENAAGTVWSTSLETTKKCVYNKISCICVF